MSTRDYNETLMEELKDPIVAASYIRAAVEERGEAALLLAIRTVAEARGISEVATNAGIGRTSLYKSLCEDGNPKISTLRSVLHSVGLKLSVECDNNI